MQCLCAYYIDGIYFDHPSSGCTSNSTCETEDVCYLQLSITSSGHGRYHYNCFHITHGLQISDTACEIQQSNQVVRCCNSSDLCNKYIYLPLPRSKTTAVLTPLPTLQYTADDSKGSVGCIQCMKHSIFGQQELKCPVYQSVFIKGVMIREFYCDSLRITFIFCTSLRQ